MISGYTNYMKRLAAWIGKKSEGVSVAGKKVLLLGLLLLGGGYYCYTLFTVFDSKKSHFSVSISHVKVPRHVTAKEETTRVAPVRRKTETGRFRFLDSPAEKGSRLKKHNGVKWRRTGPVDSIMGLAKQHQLPLKK